MFGLDENYTGDYSNTTLVKVKFCIGSKNLLIVMYSNTTLVKVKYKIKEVE